MVILTDPRVGSECDTTHKQIITTYYRPAMFNLLSVAIMRSFILNVGSVILLVTLYHHILHDINLL